MHVTRSDKTMASLIAIKVLPILSLSVKFDTSELFF